MYRYQITSINSIYKMSKNVLASDRQLDLERLVEWQSELTWMEASYIFEHSLSAFPLLNQPVLVCWQDR